MSAAQCGRCASPLESRTVFQFQAPEGAVVKCWRCALRHGPMLGRSLRIALVVGTILVGINQGDLLLRGQWSAALIWKLPLTYAVPFLVATWSALVNSRARPAR
jgi:hypothetical protein